MLLVKQVMYLNKEKKITFLSTLLFVIFFFSLNFFLFQTSYKTRATTTKQNPKQDPQYKKHSILILTAPCSDDCINLRHWGRQKGHSRQKGRSLFLHFLWLS